MELDREFTKAFAVGTQGLLLDAMPWVRHLGVSIYKQCLKVRALKQKFYQDWVLPHKVRKNKTLYNELNIDLHYFT